MRTARQRTWCWRPPTSVRLRSLLLLRSRSTPSTSPRIPDLWGPEVLVRQLGESNSSNRTKEQAMTGKADFTQQEWNLVLEGPPSAGMIVVTAQRGGTIRETFAIAKAYVEARQQHGESELLDEIVAAKPELDHTRYHSVEELKQHGLQHLRDAVELLERKATPAEVEGYRRFVLTLADKVASAHREGGASVGEAERAAITDIATSLGNPDR